MTETSPSSSNDDGSSRRGFGVDVGGSGVKGGIVDLDTGQLIGERFKLPTPQPSTPESVAKTIAEVVEKFGWRVGSVSPTPASSPTESCRRQPTSTRAGSAPTPRR